MRIQLEQRVLHDALRRVYPAVGTHEVMNSLSFIRLVASETELRFSAQDQKFHGEMTVPVDGEAVRVDEAGEACIFAKGAMALARKLPPKPVLMEREGNDWVTLRCQRGRYSLTGMSPLDMLPTAEPVISTPLRVPKIELTRLLAKTIPTMSSDGTRMSLNGIFIHVRSVDDERVELIAVSTDGHRMTKAVATFADVAYRGGEWSAIVHRDGAQNLATLLDGPDGIVEVGVADQSVLFACNHAVYSIRQIEETFPEWERVIPKESDRVVHVSRTAWADAIQQVSRLATASRSLAAHSFNDEDLVVELKNPETGEGRVRVDIHGGGPAVGLYLNTRYVGEALALVQGDDVEVSMTADYAPVVIRDHVHPDDAVVIMPMRNA